MCFQNTNCKPRSLNSLGELIFSTESKSEKKSSSLTSKDKGYVRNCRHTAITGLLNCKIITGLYAHPKYAMICQFGHMRSYLCLRCFAIAMETECRIPNDKRSNTGCYYSVRKNDLLLPYYSTHYVVHRVIYYG